MMKKITPLSYTYYYASYYKELLDFFTCVKDDVETPVTAYDGLEILKIIGDVYNKGKVSE